MAFWEEKVELLRRGEVQKSWLYADLKQFVFISSKGKLGSMHFFLGSMGKKVEDEWQWEDEEALHRFQLEIDSKYRKGELSTLCAHLQKNYPHFEQKSS